MKKILSLIVCGVIIAFYCSTLRLEAVAEQAGNGQAEPCASLTSVSGPIKYGGGNSDDFTLYNPEEARLLKIMEHDRIITGDETTAELLIAGSAKIEIREKSQVQVGHRNLRIKTGDIWVNYKPVKNGDMTTFKIFTPTGTIGIKGTQFEVRVTGETGSTYVKVTEGQVALETPDGTQSVLISPGEELLTEIGRELGVPTKSGAGDVKAPNDGPPQETPAVDAVPARRPSKRFGGFDEMSGYSIEILKK